MVRLTDVHEIAGLVSSVTEVMCGASFSPWDPLARGESLSGRMVLLPLIGPRAIRIALACDGRGGRALAVAMLHRQASEMTSRQIDDAIGEMLNAVAGQVQRLLSIDQPLGLPRPTTLAELGGPGTQDAVLLRSHGEVDLRLWIFEEGAAVDALPAVSQLPVRSRFRSLIRRLVP